MRLSWNDAGSRVFETGCSNGVLYIPDPVTGVYNTGVAWSGLTNVTESPSGAESNKQYADNQVYLNLKSAEEFGATVECFTFPDEFAPFDGNAVPHPGVYVGQQRRGHFGLSYQTLVGNELVGTDAGFKVHLVYGCDANPSEKTYATVNDSPEATTFSYELTTTPVAIPGILVDGKPLKPTASLTIDSTKVAPAAMTRLLNILYGTDAVTGPPAVAATTPRLPLPAEVIPMFAPAA